MATVVQVPADRRFAELGKGLGIFFAARKEKEEEDERRAAYKEALSLTRTLVDSTDPITGEQQEQLGESLLRAGAEEQFGDFVERISKMRGVRASTEAATALAKGRPEDELATPGISLEQQLTAAKTRKALAPESRQEGERKLTVFKDGDEKEIIVPKNIPESEIDAFVEKHASGFSRIKKEGKPTPRTETETERDIQGILIRRDVKDPTDKDKANARNLLRGRSTVNAALASNFSGDIIRDPLGNITRVIIGPAADQIKYNIALGLSDDMLFSGTDPNDVAPDAIREAERLFSIGEGKWLPLGVRDGGPDAIAKFLEVRKITAPEVVTYFRDLELSVPPSKANAQQIDAAKDALRRVLRTFHPDATDDEIEAAVNQEFADGP